MIKSTDHGLAEFERKLKERLTVTVGIHEAEGAAAKDVAPGEAESGLSLIEVAEDHEFGLGVPMRSFVRGAVDDHPELEAKYAESMRTALKPGGRGVEQQAQRFGLYVVGLMQQRIADGIPPELSPATLKYKASLNISTNAKETPLILTGQLRSSIRAKVEKT